MPTWMNRSKESEAARQAARRATRQTSGNCIQCGLARDPRSRQLCTRHLEEQRIKANARNKKKLEAVLSEQGEVLVMMLRTASECVGWANSVGPLNVSPQAPRPWKRGDCGLVLIAGCWRRMHVVTRTRKPSPEKPERWRVFVYSLPCPHSTVDVTSMARHRP